jgi:hypothetical protein
VEMDERRPKDHHDADECWGSIQHERELREQWQSAHIEVHRVQDTALSLAHTQMLEWKHEVNQVRQQIDKERGEFVLRKVYEEQHNSLRDTFDVRMKAVEKQQIQIGAVVAVLVVGLQLFLHFLGK